MSLFPCFPVDHTHVQTFIQVHLVKLKRHISWTEWICWLACNPSCNLDTDSDCLELWWNLNPSHDIFTVTVRRLLYNNHSALQYVVSLSKQCLFGNYLQCYRIYGPWDWSVILAASSERCHPGENSLTSTRPLLIYCWLRCLFIVLICDIILCERYILVAKMKNTLVCLMVKSRFTLESIALAAS